MFEKKQIKIKGTIDRVVQGVKCEGDYIEDSYRFTLKECRGLFFVRFSSIEVINSGDEVSFEFDYSYGNSSCIFSIKSFHNFTFENRQNEKPLIKEYLNI